MNLNQGKRNKQAVQVLNKVEYDSEGNPIGMMEDPSNPASANFGTPREPRRGGCYLGDGSAYITITGLLSTDTVEVMEGSDLPTISNGRLDIASGDKVFGVKIFRAGELWGKYNCSENSGSIAYDSSGNGNHGTIINAITTTPEENPNSIHQYQDVYSFENEEGYSESGSVLIPKNSSITLPPFKDVLGNNLQYVGKVPGKAKFVGSSCFKGDGGGLALAPPIPIAQNLMGVITTEFTFTIDYIVSVTYTRIFGWNVGQSLFDIYLQHVNNRYTLILDLREDTLDRVYLGSYGIGTYKCKIVIDFDASTYGTVYAYIGDKLIVTQTLTDELTSTMKEFGIGGANRQTSNHSPSGAFFRTWNFKQTFSNYPEYDRQYPLCEPIIDPSNHIYHDVSGNGNHATLVNGTLANNGKQDEFHYLQRGFGRGGAINKFVSWSAPTNITLTNNAGLAPDGSNTAILLTETLTNEPVRHYNTFSTASPKPYPIISHSIYAKYNGRRYLSIGSWGWSVELFCIVDLLEGKIVWERYNRLTKIRAEITILPNGWIRLIQEGYNNATEGTPQFYHVGLSDGTPIPSWGYQPPAYVGDGISGAYIWNLKVRDSETEVVPLIENSVWDVYGDYIATSQDTHSFLNTGTELQAYDYPALKQADKDDDFWNEDDGLGAVTPKPVQFDSLITQNGLSDKLFLDSSVNETVKNVRMYGNDLKGRQLNTENKLTNN